MSRRGSQNLVQAIGAHAMRAGATPWPFAVGKVSSYDPTTHTGVVLVDYYDEDFDSLEQQATPFSQVLAPWWGQNYGDQGGPEEGAQVLLALADPGGNQFVMLGYVATTEQTGLGVPAGERKVIDKSGSFIHHAQQRGGMIRAFGAAIASLFGAQGTEVGGENLDPTENAIIRKNDLDAAFAAFAASLKTDLTTWALAKLSPGTKALGPTTINTIETSGSTTTRAAN